MEKKYGYLLAFACLLGGLVLGFLLAPIRKGVYCGNNNGNSYYGPDGIGHQLDGPYDGEDGDTVVF